MPCFFAITPGGVCSKLPVFAPRLGQEYKQHHFSMGKRLPEIKKITIRQRQVIRLCHKKEKLRNQREKGRGERMRKEKVTKMEGRKKEK